MCLVSIIVAVYNAEAYLSRCLDSLLRQTFQNFEILLIDDGSTDNSATLCDNYAGSDNRIRVFHKSNGGVSNTRQYGVNNAKGIYTIHVDPDDWVESNMLQDLYDKAISSQADIVICDYYSNTLNSQIYIKQQPVSCSSEQVLEDIMFQRLHGSLCNKLIKLTCYKNHNVEFPKDMNYCEDQLVLLQMLQKPLVIAYLNKAYYHYDQHINISSITRSYSYKTFLVRTRYLEILKNVLSPSLCHKYYSTQFSLVAFEAFLNDIFSTKAFVHHFGMHKADFRSAKIPLFMKIFLLLSTVYLKKPALLLFNSLLYLKKKISI